MKVYRVHMDSGEKTEIDMSKWPYQNGDKEIMARVNNFNHTAALQAEINRNNPKWLYYWV